MDKKKKRVCLVLAALLALTVCAGMALAADGALYCHGGGHHGGGHHGGDGHHSGDHGTAEACGWRFHAYGDCSDVNCTREGHVHRCTMDCADAGHQHYGVCQYTDGTLALTQRVEACDWRFHAYGTCADVNCTRKDHAHRCTVDCTDAGHQHYGVCKYADGTFALTQKTEVCGWLFRACGDCTDVNCTDETHVHRCPVDCGHAEHQHCGVCQYADGTLALLEKKA